MGSIVCLTTSSQESVKLRKAAQHECRQCNQTFTERKSLLRHVRAKHEAVTFTCSICLDTFARRDIRDRHEYEQHHHNGDSIECPHCGKLVTQRYAAGHRKRKACAVPSFAGQAKGQAVVGSQREAAFEDAVCRATTAINDGLSLLIMLNPMLVALRLCQSLTVKVESVTAGQACFYREWRSPEVLKSSSEELRTPFDLCYRTMRSSIKDHAAAPTEATTLSLMAATYLMTFVEAFTNNLAAAKLHKNAYVRLWSEVANAGRLENYIHNNIDDQESGLPSDRQVKSIESGVHVPCTTFSTFEQHLKRGIEELDLVPGLPLEERLKAAQRREEDFDKPVTLGRMPYIFYVWSPRERRRILAYEEVLACL